MNNRFPDEVEQVLRSAGWTGGPKDKMPVEPLPEIELFQAAEEVLKEFGGVYYNPEITKGIEFSRAKFVIRPESFSGIENYYQKEEQAIGKKLYPIGEYLNYPMQLLIAEDGTPYSWSGFGLFQDGNNFDDALSFLILGKRPESGFTNYPVFWRNAQPGEKGVARFEHLEMD